MSKKVTKYLCPKCDSKINREKKNVSPDYFRACLECDEDFYKFELNEVQDE